MTPSRKYARELTGDEFIKIISAQPTDSFVSQYLKDEYYSSGGNLRARIDESVRSGSPRTRNIIPINFVSTTFQQGAGINGQNDFPFYTILDPVDLKDIVVEWSVMLSRCQFAEKVKFTNCSFNGGISITNCSFRKGMELENVHSPNASFSEMDSMTNVRIIKSHFDRLSFSGVVLPPKIENTKVGDLSIWPTLARSNS